MFRKAAITFSVFAVVALLVFGAGKAIDPDQVSLPQALLHESPCPATGCASGECHGFDTVPVPDGVHEMTCPEARCTSAECHAWDTLTTRYYQPSDASLNLWVLAPVVLVIGLVLLVRKL